MTFSAFGPRYSYAGNGVTVNFSFPRGFMVATDLKVYLVDDATGVETLQTLTTHYTVSGGGSGTSSGTVTFLTAPATGKTVVIYRDTDQSQNLTSVPSGNPTAPEETQLDRTMMTVDEDRMRLARTLFTKLTDIDGSGRMDARGNRIINAADPVSNQDVVTKAYALANLVGPQGPQGNPGTNGTNGTNGAPGSVWRSGTGAPSGALGIVGDWYLDDANGDVYEKTGSSTYTLRDNLMGPAGSGTGDVVGPAASVDNEMVLFSGTTGKIIKRSAGTGFPQISSGVVQSYYSVPAGSLVGTTATQTLTNKTITTVASASGGAGFNLPHGAAPSAPVNGDFWTTTGGIFGRINGSTVQMSVVGHTHAQADITNLTTDLAAGKNAALGYTIDNGASVITTGNKKGIYVPFACTITEWTIGLDQSGSIVIDIWVDSHANYPPTVADTITASAKPTVTTATKGQSSTLTGWTTAIPAGSWVYFNVDSVTSAQRADIILKVTKT